MLFITNHIITLRLITHFKILILFNGKNTATHYHIPIKKQN